MSNPQKHMFDHFLKFGHDILEILNSDNHKKIFNILEDNNINNQKGGSENPESYVDRFKDIISDPNNLFINRNEDAGKLENGIITLHNGIKLFANYYGDFIKILQYNLGVHEPSEERAFDMVLSKIKEGGSMVELGSYWSMYSIWFSKKISNSKVYCIESDENNINVGVSNFVLNNLKPNFTKGKICKGGLDLNEFFLEKKINYIDILHSDIQGHEYELLEMIQPLLVEKKIKYLFISTHSDKLHYDCFDFLVNNDYKLLCSCDFGHETFQYDGFLLACPSTLNEIEPFYIGNRRKTKLINDQELYEIIKNNS